MTVKQSFVLLNIAAIKIQIISLPPPFRALNVATLLSMDLCLGLITPPLHFGYQQANEIEERILTFNCLSFNGLPNYEQNNGKKDGLSG